ncbi:MAG: SdrD B-like domain-containing protein, partial [Coriobacteriia bacterium]|nr:SdrD B-like domain-containing protein [Coriobacteriia bacterium]
MLWAKVRKDRLARAMSVALALMLVTSLVSPGVAVFADETSAVSEVEMAPMEAPVPDPVADDSDESIKPEKAEKDSKPDVVVEEPHDVPVVSEVEEPVLAASVEVSPLTVSAASLLVPVEDSGNVELSTGPRSDFPDPIVVGEGCDLTTIAIFWAGQNYEAGTVSATTDDTNLYVTFATSGGWTMGLTHLYVGLVPPASYAPGSFPYQTTHNPAVTSYMYTIPLANIGGGAGVGDTIYIAAHAEVSNGQQSETAWAGVGEWPGLLFSHTIPECEEPDTADLTVMKFNDLNEDGVHDDGEPMLEGFMFTLSFEGSVIASGTTGADGSVVFPDLDDGTYMVDEVPMIGWMPTTELPYEVSVVEGQDVTIHIGNRELPEEPEDVVKSFSLTFENAPEGAQFYASFDFEGLVLVPLTGDGPYTGEYELPHGTTITVTWWIVLDGEFIVLGEGESETLTEDVLNELTYEASASGFKFDDVNADGVWDEVESGMSGWTIYLYRIVESDPIEEVQAQAIMLELYATTITGEGGAYSFSGLVPGAYMVAEEDREGWTMTVGPEGDFEVMNGSAVTGLIFGNAEDGLPFTPLDLAIEKVAGVSEADPGDIVTYTITFRNLGPGVAMNYTIVEDFDVR